MAISLLDNFNLGAKKPNFARDLFDTVADMAAFSENYLPDVFECNVKENGNRYRYNVNNTVDSTTGKWRLVDGGGGSDLPEVINNRFLHTNADTGELEWSTIEAGSNVIEQYYELPAPTMEKYNNKIIFNEYEHEFYISEITRSAFRKYTNSNNETIYIKEVSSDELVYILDVDDLVVSTNYQLYVTEDDFGYYDREGNDHKFFADDFESSALYRYCFWKLYRSYETSLPEPYNDDNILISNNNHWNQTSKEDFLSNKQDKLPDEGYGFLYKDANTGEIEWVDNDKLKFRNTISSTDQPYLYTGHCYEKPNWEKINEFMEDKFLDGGCSGAVRNGKFYRSFDFLYNDTASFVIENHACGYKGMAGAKSEVTKTLIDNGGDDEWFDYLPFDLLDGINLSGIAVSTYILHREGDRTNQGDSKQKICTSVLATYLLCNLKDIDDLADVVDEICVYAPNSTEHPEFSAEYHWMITNGTKTVCLEYVNNSPVITDISANPYIANFYLYDWDGSDLSTTNAHAQGIERWNILKDGGSLEDVAYTHTYSLIGTDNVWRSDFNDVWQNGIDITTSTPDDDPDLLAVQTAAKSAWENRTRGNGTWHTQHACIYDFATRSFKVCTQESYDTWYPNVYTKSETDTLLSDKQDNLPTVTNDRYLHTNATTGELEWSSVGDSVEIDDTTTSTDKVWSSDKVNTELSDKASLSNDNEFLGQLKFPTEQIDDYTILDSSYIGVEGNGGNNSAHLYPGYLYTVEKSPYGDSEFWGNTNYHAWGIEHIDRGRGINCNLKFPSTNGTLATEKWVEEAFGVDFIKCVEVNPVADVFTDPKVIFNTTSEKFYSLKLETRSFKKYTNVNEETIYVFDLVDGADVYSARVDGRIRPTRTKLVQEDDYFIYHYTDSGMTIEELFYAEDYVENVNAFYGYWEEIEIGGGEGYTKEETDDLLDTKVDNTDIVTSFGATPSDTKIPSEKLVKDSLDSKPEIDNSSTTSTTKTWSASWLQSHFDKASRLTNPSNQISSGTDLNTLTTLCEMYASKSVSSTLSHCPVSSIDFKLTIKKLYDLYDIVQVLETVTDTYTRYYKNSTWSDWVKVLNEGDIVISFNATLSDEKIPSEKLVKDSLDSKVDKETGKGLSTNDYTTTEKNKLAGIATGATKVTVDSALSSTSTNAIQNNVVNAALSGKASTSVATSSANGLMSKEDKIKLDSITIVIS